MAYDSSITSGYTNIGCKGTTIYHINKLYNTISSILLIDFIYFFKIYLI